MNYQDICLMEYYINNYNSQDGVILKVSFDGDKAIASYKYVETEGYLLENQ